MPIYIYKHPSEEKYVEIVQSMNDEHVHFDEDGLQWKRVWSNPQLNCESNIDPFDNVSFIEKTGKMKGSFGDVQDYSKELSEQRKKMNNGVDPVQKKYFENYSKKRKGAKHSSELKQRTCENKNWKVTKKKSVITNSEFVVVLDPGHGGKDPGAEAGEYRESNLMLELAAAVKESLMRNTDFKVILTRNEDVFLSLEDRITIATQSGADLFISLHADAVIEGEASGTTVYLLNENATDKMSAQLASRHNPSEILRGVDLSGLDSQVASVLIDMARQETKPRNEAFAQFILEVFKEKITELSSQPLRYAAFSVLKSPDIPSVLIEAGFMSTSSNLQNLITPIWRMEFADALSEAILRWQIKDAQKKFLKLE